MYVGVLSLDLLLGDVRSLKEKRGIVQPVIAAIARKFPAAGVAQTGQLDRYRRTEIGVAVVASTAAHCTEVLDACERLVADRPEVDVLAARQRLFTEED